MQDPFALASFVWVEDNAPRRNQFVRFTRQVNLAEAPSAFPLALFADTRYRLSVNGSFVYAGPGRFVTQFPEYDEVDLASFLKVGENRIVVEVNFYGASAFQTMPDGEPGFIAAGGTDEVSLATPGDWVAERCTAWDPDAPVFSFAQGPVEILDTRKLDAAHPVPIVKTSGPWGPLKPFSGTPLPFNFITPKQIELAGPLVTDETRYGFMSHDPAANRPLDGSGPRKPYVAFATWIHSPEPQRVTFSCFWSDLKLNDELVDRNRDTLLGNHNSVDLSLNEGWNLLTGDIEVLTEYWAYLLGVPRDRGLTLHGLPSLEESQPLAIGPTAPRETLVLPTLADRGLLPGWHLDSGDTTRVIPARMVGWDRPAEGSRTALPVDHLPTVGQQKAGNATWCFSFVGEFHGHIQAEVEAPAGTVLDIACDDWQRTDGGVNIYNSNPFTDAADRFILAGGRQTIELFHARGGKLIQLTMRAPADSGPSPLIVHDLKVRSRLIYQSDESRFDSDNEVLNWLWPVAIRTLTHSTDDAYADCPWRERGSYIGDGLVNLHLNLLFTSDLRTGRRTFRTFAQAAMPNGQLPACAPAWLRRPHEDFSLLWIHAIHDFWAHTGDLDLASEMWPTIEGIWASEAWEDHESGLWSSHSKSMFLDWGVLPEDRVGDANAAINILRIEAARRIARLTDALGKSEAAARFLAEAADVEGRLFEWVWDETEGRLRASLESDSPALHANVLAFGMGIGTVANRQRILDYLEPHLRTNLARGLSEGQFKGHLELYFLSYVLPALAEFGRADLAEQMIQDHYGYLKGVGDDTLPECFCRVEQGEGSRCHSWSGAGAIYAARYVLGLRQHTLGNPNRFVLSPIVSGITRASGRVAHPLGWIEIDWHFGPTGLVANVHAPEGVRVDVLP